MGVVAEALDGQTGSPQGLVQELDGLGDQSAKVVNLFEVIPTLEPNLW